jgi:hypothetical protein
MMANLSSIPFELVGQIISLIPRKTTRHPKEPRLSPLATVSRIWQNIVEAILFEDIAIESKEWTAFIALTRSSGMDRRGYLKRFHIQVKDLDSLEEPLQFVDDSESDQRQYGRRLRCTVQDIYKEFGNWGKHLNLLRFYLSLPHHPIVEQSYSQEYRSLVARIPYISIDWLSEANNWKIQLAGIQKFYLSSDESRIAPASALSIVSTMPDVKFLNMEFDEHEKKDISWRKDLRNSNLASNTNVLHKLAPHISMRRTPPIYRVPSYCINHVSIKC